LLDLAGESEVLVVWKPEWIPISYLHEPLRSQWLSVPKWIASQGIGGLVMNVMLPVVPESTLEKDVKLLASQTHQLDIRQFMTPSRSFR
jgi:hypothetical protein